RLAPLNCSRRLCAAANPAGNPAPTAGSRVIAQARFDGLLRTDLRHLGSSSGGFPGIAPPPLTNPRSQLSPPPRAPATAAPRAARWRVLLISQTISGNIPSDFGNFCHWHAVRHAPLITLGKRSVCASEILPFLRGPSWALRLLWRRRHHSHQ